MHHSYPFRLFTALSLISITNLTWNLHRASQYLTNIGPTSYNQTKFEEVFFSPQIRKKKVKIEDGRSNGNSKCAILFFGLLKQPNQVLPAIQRNIIKPNSQCDLFVHTYNVTSTSNRRNHEHNASLNPMEIYNLTSNIVMDTEEEFLNKRNVTYYRQFFPNTDTSWVYPTSMDNMIKQWHSIEQVWNYMELSNIKQYDRIGLFRADLLYTEPINIQIGGDAVFPSFGTHYVWGVINSINDRMFYGNYENAKIWATKRFPSVEKFINIRRQLGELLALRSETYLAWVFADLVDNLNFRSMCGWRIRAGGAGEVKRSDCMGPRRVQNLANKLDKQYNTTISSQNPKCSQDQILLEKALLWQESIDPGTTMGISLFIQKHAPCVYINY